MKRFEMLSEFEDDDERSSKKWKRRN
jgi:hypothetical protein